MSIVRISIGHFDPEKYEIIRGLLDNSQNSLIPVIRELRGNHAYYVGIDRVNSMMTNVSIWESIEDAQQMSSLQEMMDLAKIFIDAGVRFDRPITNQEIIWKI